MRSLRLLTNSKPPAIVVQRSRFVIYFLVGLATSLGFGMVLSILGAFCIAMPLAFLSAFTHPFMMTAAAGVAALIIWSAQYFAGFFYMDIVSRLGFNSRKEVLTPIFLSSLLFWIGAGWTVAAHAGVNFGTFACLLGFALNIYGQRQKMQMLRRSLQYNHANTNVFKIESQGDLQSHLCELKTAENLEHLEQLSKQCLVTIKPALAASSDCTSALIDELMKRKLSAEADELSLLQLTLSEQHSP